MRMIVSRVVCSCGVVIGLWGSGAVSSASCGFLVLMASSGRMLTASGKLVPDEGSVLASSWVTSPGPVVVEVVALSIRFLCVLRYSCQLGLVGWRCPARINSQEQCFQLGLICIVVFSVFLTALSGSNIQRASSHCSKYVSQVDPVSVLG